MDKAAWGLFIRDDEENVDFKPSLLRRQNAQKLRKT
jgi:hypothetical protein